MKTKILSLLIVFIGVFGTAVNAHPPSKIELSYNLEEAVMHVEMRHTTHDPREDYIRKIEVVVNSKEPITKRYNIQPNTMLFEDDIVVTAEEGDTIIIKAFSKEGGTGTASIVVEAKEEDEEDKKVNKKKKDVIKSKGSGY